MTEVCRPVGCRLLGLSPSRLSPGWFVAQMNVDPTLPNKTSTAANVSAARFLD